MGNFFTAAPQQPNPTRFYQSGFPYLKTDLTNPTTIKFDDIELNPNIQVATKIECYSLDGKIQSHTAKSDHVFEVSLSHCPCPESLIYIDKLVIKNPKITYDCSTTHLKREVSLDDCIIEYVNAGLCAHHIYNGIPVTIESIITNDIEYAVRYC